MVELTPHLFYIQSFLKNFNTKKVRGKFGQMSYNNPSGCCNSRPYLIILKLPLRPLLFEENRDENM